ncbi:hypothetical protein FZC75_17320 [Sutcliffiella horikoshii]|uniref:Uncharacterized protein n=1 Tax=Sutcliffiella horikoshii TaxID=79883 RepID=A0A5D4T1Q7_9BACI|nr:hypothetical protein FZC75_17320 [Sutcliffiella horikoshii]
MVKRKGPTVKYLVMMSSVFCLSIILQSIVVVSTPHPFVRIINLIAIIGASGIVGAFIREIYILKNRSSIH